MSTQINILPRIAILVIALHATLILFLAVFSFSPPQIAPKPRVVVHTVQLKRQAAPPAAVLAETPKPVVQETVSQSAVLAETPKPVVQETVSQTVVEKPKAKPKKPSPKKVAPKVEPKEKAASRKEKSQAKKTKQQKLLAQAAESIGKIRPSGVKIDPNQKGKTPELLVPQLKLAPVAIDEIAGWSVGEVSYRDELAERLKLQLVLPEYGSVKLKLTLQRSGEVIRIAILSADSRRNRDYVEKRVPSLQFPPFGNQFSQEPEHTFTITLNNDF
jgi:colicin import membrane protein